MKKLTFLAVMLVCSLMAFSQVKRVAILEVVDTEGKLTYAQKLMLRSGLTQAIADTPGYEAYSRSDMDAIMSEQDFQRTGNVSKEQIQRLGEMTGAEYILKTEAIITNEKTLFGKTAPQLYVTAQIIVVETSQVDLIRYHTMWAETDKILQGCKELTVKLFGSPTAENTTIEQSQSALVVQQPVAVVEENIVYSKKKEPQLSIVREKGEYYYSNGNYLSKKEYKNLLKNTCPAAFAQYKKGQGLIGSGWTFFAAGLASCAVGWVLYECSYVYDEPYINSGYYDEYGDYYYDDSYTSSNNTMETVGFVCMGIGGGLTISSIPMLCVGYSKRNKSVDIYNKNCAPDIAYNITAGKDGIGLAINF